MTEADFAFLRRLLLDLSGLSLGRDKRYLVESRLQPLCRKLAIGSLAELVARLRRSAEPHLIRFVIEAMTTNETLFFRDKATFDAIRSPILPELIAARAGARRLRIWSAAASTGQEAYSLAMILDDLAPALGSFEVSILATDISAAAIARAQAGLYSQLEVQRGLPVRALLRHFAQEEDGWRISPSLRESVRFRPFNLLDETGPLGRFDLILCRNLLIYFSAPGKAALLAKLTAALEPGGVLCVGSAETARGVPGLVADPVLHGIYRRVAAEERRPTPALRATG